MMRTLARWRSGVLAGAGAGLIVGAWPLVCVLMLQRVCGWRPLEVALGVVASAATMAVVGALVARQERRLRQLAFLDALTGLPNRRALDRRLDDEVARHRRYGAPFALLLIDVDRLKTVNDH